MNKALSHRRGARNTMRVSRRDLFLKRLAQTSQIRPNPTALAVASFHAPQLQLSRRNPLIISSRA